MTVELAFDVRGTGDQPVVCLHGFLGAGRNLASLARKLGEAVPQLRLILPDLSGHGSSPALPAQGTLRSTAQAVLDLADHLRLPQPYAVLGHSLGGRVALQMLALAPHKLAQVLFIDIPPGPVDLQRSAMRQVFTALLQAPEQVAERAQMRSHLAGMGVQPALCDWLLLNLVAAPGGGWHWRIDRTWLRALQQQMAQVDLWGTVSTHARRLHCVAGGDSDYLTPADLQRLRALHVDVHVLPGAGHFVHVDRQAELVQVAAAVFAPPSR